MMSSAGFLQPWPGSHSRTSRIRRHQRAEDVLQGRGASDTGKVPLVQLHDRDFRDRNLLRAVAGPAGASPSGARRGAASPRPDRRHRPAHVDSGDGRRHPGRAGQPGHRPCCGPQGCACLGGLRQERPPRRNVWRPRPPESPATLRRDLQSAFEQEYRALPPTRATGRPC